MPRSKRKAFVDPASFARGLSGSLRERAASCLHGAPSVLSALLFGLALGATSAVHCVAMCGPLNAFVALDAEGSTDPMRVARYHAGRVLGYGALGAVLGGLGGSVTSIAPRSAETILSVVLAASLGLAARQIWPRTTVSPRVSIGRAPRGATLLERATRAVAALLTRVRRLPFVLGTASALLPCGVIASGALLAAGTGHVVMGALAMAGLAITSGLGVGLAGAALGHTRVTRSTTLARAMAVTLVLGALVLVSRPVWIPIGGEPPACH